MPWLKSTAPSRSLCRIMYGIETFCAYVCGELRAYTSGMSFGPPVNRPWLEMKIDASVLPEFQYTDPNIDVMSVSGAPETAVLKIFVCVTMNADWYPPQLW